MKVSLTFHVFQNAFLISWYDKIVMMLCKIMVMQWSSRVLHMLVAGY
jgi:hypothetical protein